MKHFLFLLLLPFFGVAQQSGILKEDYSFLLTNGKVAKLHQSNDTLYILNCYTDQPCLPRPDKRYKVLSTQTKDGLTLLKLERLDTIPFTPDPYPDNRFDVLVLKQDDYKELGVLDLYSRLKREQLDTVRMNTKDLKEKFYFTYYSDSYLEELSALKPITTSEEVENITAYIDTKDWKPLLKKYNKTDVFDMYASGLSAEILNRACIEKGYNPIGAGRVISAFKRQRARGNN